jgi:Asp-tRNA(Asn)/Glu-tRNA(Gln) amidotransferase A subunit family amidase
MVMSLDERLRGYVGLADDFRSGKINPRVFLDETLDRIDRLDSRIKAFVALNKDGAAKAADAAAARWREGTPLSAIDGMPIAVKDVIETADMPTGQGSPLLEGRMLHFDSASVHALREAGAVIVGKTTTTEFAATESFHATQNPYDGLRTPGGSSSGSAAAVAAGMVPVALGTQVVGSIVRPASYCGAIGFKPSYGAINRSGSHDHFSQGCQGAIGATLADTWFVLRAIAERAGGDPGNPGLNGDPDFSAGTRPARIAMLETIGWAQTTAGARAALANARRKLEGAGVEMRSRADDPLLEEIEGTIADAVVLTTKINTWEGHWPRNTYADLDASKLSAASLNRIQVARTMTQRDYRALLTQRAAMRAAFERAAGQYDLFVTLGACGAAPRGLESTGNPAMNITASALGVPALTLPILSDEGLPLGLQVLSGLGRDAELFAAATWLLSNVFERRDLI